LTSAADGAGSFAPLPIAVAWLPSLNA